VHGLPASRPVASPAWRRLTQFLPDLEEPPRRGCIHDIISHWLFELVTSAIVVLHCALIIYVTEKAAREASVHHADEIVHAELAFYSYYLLELLLKLFVHRLYFFTNEDARWNVFDLCIVGISTLDFAAYVMDPEDPASTPLLRLTRVCRVARPLRMFRAIRVIRELRLLMNCIVGSFSSLVWCMALLVSIASIFSVFIVEHVTAFLHEQRQGRADSLEPET
jgi:hypothetical protein